jgi:Tfp pilus assembly protein PilN
MEAVNLLPAYARPAQGLASLGKDFSTRRVLKIGGAVAGAVAIAFGGAFLYERSVVNDRRDALADTQAQLAVAQAKAEPLRAAQSQAVAKLGTVRRISTTRVSWELVLRDLARVLPSNVALQTLQVQSPAPIAPIASAASSGTAPVGAGVSTGFTVSGVASSHDRVALLLDRLAMLPWLSNVTLQSSTRGGDGGAGGSSSVDQFTVSANFTTTGGAR